MIYLLLGLLLPLVSSLRYTQFEFFKKFALDWIVDLERVEPDVGGTVAGIVRLAWHDGGSWDPVTKTGGAHFNLWVSCSKPNACEYTAPEHKGLQDTADALLGIYNAYGFGRVISRADWLHIAAVVAFEHASGDPYFQIPWRWGRTDALRSPLPRWPNRLPDAQKGFSEVKRVFSRLGFTPREAVALMGGHALGKGDPANSGFSGTWTQQPNLFSNGYYQFLLNSTWDQKVLDESHSQWQTKIKGLFELNTDIALAYENDGNCRRATTSQWGTRVKGVDYNDWRAYSSSSSKSSSSSSSSSSASGYCPRRQGMSDFVVAFADAEFEWLMEFTQAWQRLSEFGNKMREVCDDYDPDPSCDYMDPYGAPIRKPY